MLAKYVGAFVAGMVVCYIGSRGHTAHAKPNHVPAGLKSVRADLQDLHVEPSKKVVLVTGAAGFIGFHTTLALHAQGDTVIGLDNFNDYYDVGLKQARAVIMRDMDGSSFKLVEGDVCDGELLRTLLKSGRVTNVIHLAAQAGVRYSLKNPLAYVQANVKCFVTLLEAVAFVDKTLPVTYASSSSVYGLNTEVPFSVYLSSLPVFLLCLIPVPTSTISLRSRTSDQSEHLTSQC